MKIGLVSREVMTNGQFFKEVLQKIRWSDDTFTWHDVYEQHPTLYKSFIDYGMYSLEEFGEFAYIYRCWLDEQCTIASSGIYSENTNN